MQDHDDEHRESERLADPGSDEWSDRGRSANALEGTELPDQPVRRERLLPGSTDDAWELLRDADGLERWLADEVDLTVAPGEQGQVRDGDVVREVVVESVEEGRRLSLRWWTDDANPSVVDLTLDEVDGQTRLVVTEVPSRLVTAPDAVPATWSIPSEADDTRGPQLLAMAVR